MADSDTKLTPEELAEAEKLLNDINNSVRWENVQQSEIETEIGNIDKAALKLNQNLNEIMNSASGVDDLEENIGNFYSTLDETSWLGYFLRKNEETFGSDFSTIAKVPSTLAGLNDEGKVQYVKIRNYWSNFKQLQPGFNMILALLKNMFTTYKAACRLLNMGELFSKANLTKDKLMELSRFVNDVNEFVQGDLIYLDRNAKNSNEYLSKHDCKDYGEKDELKKLRTADFVKIVEESKLHQYGKFTPVGEYVVNKDLYNLFYMTDRVFRESGIEIDSTVISVYNGYYDDCQKILDLKMSADRANCPELVSMLDEIEALIKTIQMFFGDAKRAMEKLKDGGDEFPYCFAGGVPNLPSGRRGHLAEIKEGGYRAGGSSFYFIMDTACDAIQNFYARFMNTTICGDLVRPK